MGQHPKVVKAMIESVDRTGVGSGGTRNIGGTTHYMVELEKEIAQLHQKERALVGSSCYVINEAVLSTLPKFLGPDMIYFSDAGNHASMIHGVLNSRA